MAQDAANAKTPTSPRSDNGRFVDRRVAGVNPAAHAANVLQLRRARGQIDGLERMVGEDRLCTEIIVQITAARASLRVVAKSLLGAHLKSCHITAARKGAGSSDGMYQELAELVARIAK